MNELISVIVPCYNQGQFLDECLQSVFDQTYKNWHCIIVDDGSTDDTREISAKWKKKDQRFEYFYKENGGLSSARNEGLKHIRGEFIQLLDSDDVLEVNKLKSHLEHFSNFPIIDVSVSGYRYFIDNCNEHYIFGNGNFLPEVIICLEDKDVLKLFDRKNPFVISAPLYRKKIFDIVGNFDNELTALEDWDFHIRCALNALKFCHNNYGNLNKTLIRLHENSMMRNTELLIKNQELLVAKKNKNELYLKYFTPKPINEKKNFGVKKVIKLFLPPIVIKLIKIIKTK